MTLSENQRIKLVRSDTRFCISNSIAIDENHRAYVNFVSSLKASITKKAYEIRLKNYLRTPIISFSTFDELLTRNPRQLEQGIIDLIIEMRYKRQMSFSAQNILLCALTHFYSINDVLINRKKIAKFMSDSENKYEYRSYTTDEISSLLSVSDEREKMIILLLSSTGMRVGALPQIKLKDLKKWKIEGNDQYLYQIQVYSSSSKYRYFTFSTPECALAIDNYLDLRRRFGENLEKTPTGWNPPNSYLAIRAFNRRAGSYTPIPIRHRSSISSNIIIPKLESLNLRNRSFYFNESNDVNKDSKNKDLLHPCHSFRIFAITQMQRARLDKTIREMLVGHKTGLDSVYYKPQEEEILAEFLKAVDLLSITNEHRLKKELDQYNKKSGDLQLIRTQITESYEQKIQLIREEMESKFQEIMEKIDLSKV